MELQLRGRAGRQGDPGETVMLYDVTDPYIAVYNQQGVWSVVFTLLSFCCLRPQRVTLYLPEQGCLCADL